MTVPVMQATKGRIYGSGLQGVARIGGQCRALWNLFVAENANRYKAEGKFVFYSEMSAVSQFEISLPRLFVRTTFMSSLLRGIMIISFGITKSSQANPARAAAP